MKLASKVKQLLCKHDYRTVWLDDYRQHVLGEKPSVVHRISGRTAVQYCPRCGKLGQEFDIPAEEIHVADRILVCHFEERNAL